MKVSEALILARGLYEQNWADPGYTVDTAIYYAVPQGSFEQVRAVFLRTVRPHSYSWEEGKGLKIILNAFDRAIAAARASETKEMIHEIAVREARRAREMADV